ncbi:MAG TPA: metal-dependent hydrolase [Pseudomonadales bacterium]|nr:metal-dependent hydrolase [Gammaproteobacteria bacterium]HIL84140.1 metal-dependent hydrolase [Pseudomonadales bacterium]
MLDTMTVRKMPFEFPDEIEPDFMDGDHERSFSFIAGSLLLPHLEPYLIRSMRAAEKHVTDPVVLEGLKKFASQEGQHYQMHKKFNDTIRLDGFPELELLEKELSDDYHRFTKTKSLRFNLAYAEGFEALTMNAVKNMMEPNGFGEDLPVFLQMVEWHFVEELEHRTVAFDVYDHVCGGYLYRLFVGIWAQWHFTNWIRRVKNYMLKVRPQPDAGLKDVPAETMSVFAQPTSATSLMPGLLRIYLPNYTPHDVEISAGIQTLADKYSKMASEFNT